MESSNRCPACKSIANHYLTTMFGDNLYLTGCSHELVIDRQGRRFTGTVGYNSGNKVHTVIISAGKIVV